MMPRLGIPVVLDVPLSFELKTCGGLTHDFTLTRWNNLHFTNVFIRKWQSGYAAGLKPAYGGSIPPFLVSLIEFERMLVPQMCDKEEGSREVIPRLSLLILRTALLV